MLQRINLLKHSGYAERLAQQPAQDDIGTILLRDQNIVGDFLGTPVRVAYPNT